MKPVSMHPLVFTLTMVFFSLLGLFLGIDGLKTTNSVRMEYKEDRDGSWRVMVYGTVCEDLMQMSLTEADKPVIQPFVVSCDHEDSLYPRSDWMNQKSDLSYWVWVKQQRKLKLENPEK